MADPVNSRVIYVGHLPHGFFEKELRGYFGQFGRVTKVRVSRSKRTAASKGYAFLQFQHSEVAEIAAEAMNGYMMFGQKLQCQVVPVDKQHAALFKGANRKMQRKPLHSMEAQRHNKQRTPEEQEARVQRLQNRSAKRQRAIHASGIEYDAPLVQPNKAQKKVFD
eukprot:jgi/Ulvmu1/4461/UM002_0186.1